MNDITNTKEDLKESTAPSNKTKVRPNPNNIYLKDCWSYSEVKTLFPYYFVSSLDDILTGVSNLDLGGNTRPINKGLLFSLLRDLDEISTKAIKDYRPTYSDRYCRKLAGLMRVTVSAYDRLIDS